MISISVTIHNRNYLCCMTIPDKNPELQALISLLDDPDPAAYESISERILGIGPQAVQVLEGVWERTYDELVQGRIEQIVHHIQYEDVRRRLTDWVAGDENDLLDGYCIVTRFHYPELDETKIRSQFEKIRRDIWLELNDRLTALENIKVFNHILFEVHAFGQKIEHNKIYETGGYFLNTLIESHRGNPLSLGILYVALAARVGLPVYGVGLPGHFVTLYADDTVVPVKPGNILFYINPFARGAVFSRREVEMYLKQAGITPDEKYYTVCSNKNIISRLIDELSIAFEKEGENDKALELRSLRKIVR